MNPDDAALCTGHPAATPVTGARCARCDLDATWTLSPSGATLCTSDAAAALRAQARRQDDTHRCPCGCGRQIASHMLACRNGWFGLPYEIRRRISAAYQRDRTQHAAAIDDALQWYRTHRGVRT